MARGRGFRRAGRRPLLPPGEAARGARGRPGLELRGLSVRPPAPGDGKLWELARRRLSPQTGFSGAARGSEALPGAQPPSPVEEREAPPECTGTPRPRRTVAVSPALGYPEAQDAGCRARELTWEA